MWLNFRAVLAVLGYLTFGIGILMLICSIVDLCTNSYSFESFFRISIILIFLGFSLLMSYKSHIKSNMSIKEGFLLASLSWFWGVLISSLPFYFSGLKISFVDSLFESMSGYTTTGATIFSNLDNLSYGLLLWRALTEWFGGVGIIVTSTALISQFASSGMKIFKIEAFEAFENPLAKALDMIKGIIVIYIALTVVFFLALWFIARMDFFDALIHTLTNISTAGFSTKNGSVGAFNNPVADVILIIMMICGSSPFILIYYMFFLKKPNALLHDEQFKGFIIIVLTCSGLLSIWLFFNNDLTFAKSLMYGTFTVVSTISGTGSVISDYSTWGTVPIVMIFILTFIGGCGGSSACGMKIYRFQVAFKMSKISLQKLFKQNHVIVPYYNKSVIDNNFAYSVYAYFFLMFVTILVVTLLLAFTGLDFITALSGSVTTLMNVGPGIGSIIGPAGTFAKLPDMSKVIMIFSMFIGRIEIFGAFIFFYKSFWRL